MSVPHSLFTKIVDKFPQGNLSLTSSRKKFFAEVENSKPELDEVKEEAGICAVLSTPIDPDKHFEFFAHNSEDFPSLPKVKTKLVTLPGDPLIAQLSASLFAASSDETQKILNGSQLVFAYDSKKQLISLTTWTTDGHRLVRTQASKEYKTKSKFKHLDEPVSFVVPIKVLKELARQLHPIDAITIYFEPNSSSQTQAGTVMFTWDNKSLVSRTIEGQYPDCQGIIDVYKPQYNRTFICNRWFLLKALERFLVLSDKSSQGLSIRLDSRKQKAILSLERHSVGKGTEAVPIQLKGDKLEFLYNVRYLYEIVRATTSLDICFNLTSTTLPTLITPHQIMERGDLAIEAEYILAPMQG
jgi:DNA polymerase-3 subunit beta